MGRNHGALHLAGFDPLGDPRDRQRAGRRPGRRHLRRDRRERRQERHRQVLRALVRPLQGSGARLERARRRLRRLLQRRGRRLDCTVEEALCERFEVRGYPTLKYFTAETGADGEAYELGRDLDSLKAFVEETLEMKCALDDRARCSEKELAYVEKMTAAS